MAAQASGLARRYLERWAPQVERTLEALLPSEQEAPEALHRAMRYSTLGGGKRLRAVLAVAGCEAVGGAGERALALGAALEMIHAYSLIHDDLPAMDDDAFRRGKPTCHRVFGEAMALLAGDALQTLAFEVLACLPRHAGVQDATALAIVGEVARAAGSSGMAGGQAADLLAEGEPAEAAVVESIHRRKTAALITASVVSGGVLALDRGSQGLEDPSVRALRRYGEAVGLAFQIVDDLLDEPAEPQTSGQGLPKGREERKATYPRAVGLQASRRKVDLLTQEAVQCLQPLGTRGEVLRDLARWLAERSG